ncbi:phytoene desaturase family protein [Dyadobacter pollutisoli]|uniref:NAD(P)/FAD-dependent oxidoreductase n=1 Tax=Dyadobacter pollutisoli TaxID=2910158 RepID=A0A9E8N886_9BACT|nr:NAD(P)/FAD-dependent oxidoreductase [Dyadobacter pollutisoli]WAC10327.1 NAD(P)/FAD-dependent oxidoreductase [Dyadobacter pollutisoli]
MYKTEYDAVVVGSGPNGLAAGITMQRAGLSVLIVEGKPTVGGGMRSAALTLPGYVHDVCSAVHPMALLSPFFKDLPLHEFGLEFIQPTLAAAHPFDDGTAVTLDQSLAKTAERLGEDGEAYLNFMEPLVNDIPRLLPSLLGPLAWPENPLALAKFGLKALPSSLRSSNRFKTKAAKGLWAGMAAHAIQPLGNLATSAFGIMLMAAAHLNGWPIPKGGSQSIADALASYFKAIGGVVETGFQVNDLNQLPPSKVVLMDVTPRQLLSIAGDQLSSSYRSRLEKYRYGSGVFKIDWALNDVIPFKAEECKLAGTVHLGNTLEEIAHYEKSIAEGEPAGKPFVLLAQQSVFDPSRAPEGKHTAWAYCHVPNGSQLDMTAAIENQIERFAPGFRDLIIEKSIMNTREMEAYNPNYIGGDINGGIQDLWQLYSRPVWSVSPYRTSASNIYLCSSSTPPGGGVHGMCGYHAAKQAMKDVFKMNKIDSLEVRV